MKFARIILSIVLVITSQAYSAPITIKQATTAAANWARTQHLARQIGSQVQHAQAFTTDDGETIYAIQMNQGAVVTSSDTESEPIILFTTSNHCLQDISERNGALWELLNRDARVRKNIRKCREQNSGATLLSQDDAANSADRWRVLLNSALTEVSAYERIENGEGINDLRVSPLIKTTWSQTTHNDESEAEGGINCYNYYTPEHYPCGCTATALSQVMRYFQYPNGEANPRTWTCIVDGEKKNLTTVVGRYNWDLMLEHPETDELIIGEEADNEQYLQAIGALTYNVGVALKSEYSAWLTSAQPTDLGSVLTNYFSYAHSLFMYHSQLATEAYSGGGYSQSEIGLHHAETRRNVVFANLDAGLPVVFGIYGYSGSGNIGNPLAWNGHAVIGDGYGFATIGNTQVDYVHINMGWSGHDDAWYNIPEINAIETGADGDDVGCEYTVMAAALYNIFTDDSSGEILSGRVLDVDGNPVEGAVISVTRNGRLLYNAYSGANGIYSTKVQPGVSYELIVEMDENGLLADLDTGIIEASTSDKSGNKWGLDLQLTQPKVMVDEVPYASFVCGLNAAKRMGAGMAMQILCPIFLDRDYVIDESCSITTANGDVAAAPISMANGAKLIIASDVHVHLRNIMLVPETSNMATVQVLRGGVLELDGEVGLTRIITADAHGIYVASPISVINEVECAAATTAGRAFADVASGLQASDVNGLFWCKNNDELGGVLSADGKTLVWSELCEVPEGAAILRCTQDGATTNYRSWRLLIQNLDPAKSADIVLVKDSVVRTKLEIKSELSITSEAGGQAKIVRDNDKAQMVIGNQGKLALSNVIVTSTNILSDAMFTVNTGGELILGARVLLTKLDGASYCSGAILVDGGKVTMLSNSEISNCQATARKHSGESYGGAVTVISGLLDMQGGTISDCTAFTAGGGVFLDRKGKIYISGDAIVKDNFVGARASDVYLTSENSIALTGEFTGSVGVGGVSSGKIAEGSVFATVAVQMDAKASARNLFASSNPSFHGEVADDGETIFWSNRRLPRAPVNPDEASVCVDGKEYYHTLHEALSDIESGVEAEVKILQHHQISGEVVIKGKVYLTSEGDTPKVISRISPDAKILVSAGAELSISNLVVDAGNAPGKFFYVYSGKLELLDGALVCNMQDPNGWFRDSAAIVVEKGGELVMNSGSCVSNCCNCCSDGIYGLDLGSGVIVAGVNSRFTMNGGLITACDSLLGGGASISDMAVMYVSGDATITGNKRIGDGVANLIVADLSTVIVDSSFVGDIGYTCGYRGSTKVFGQALTISADTREQMVKCARRFSNDQTDALGMLAANASNSKWLLVWSTAFENGKYIGTDGVTYNQIGNIPVKMPEGQTLVYNAQCQSGIIEREWYSFTGEITGTNADTYVVSASLKPNCFWGDDESVATRELTWKIEPAILTVFADALSKEEGSADPELTWQAYGLQGDDDLSDILSGELIREAGENVGMHNILQGTLTCLSDNYQLEYVGAFLTINPMRTDFFPWVYEDAVAETVAAAFRSMDVGILDERIETEILAAADPVSVYRAFKTWAGGVDGGERAVISNEYAYIAFEFGCSELFENEPKVQFTQIGVTHLGESHVALTLKVMDGEIEKLVLPEKVAQLVVASFDLENWGEEMECNAVTTEPTTEVNLEVLFGDIEPQAYFKLIY